MQGLFEQSALAQTALDALKLQHQQQWHHQVIDVAAIGSCRKLLGNMAPAAVTSLTAIKGDLSVKKSGSFAMFAAICRRTMGLTRLATIASFAAVGRASGGGLDSATTGGLLLPIGTQYFPGLWVDPVRPHTRRADHTLIRSICFVAGRIVNSPALNNRARTGAVEGKRRHAECPL
jgi:hypothetical protein